MTHTYKISGMTCSGCLAKVQGLLKNIPGIKDVDIDLSTGKAKISMSSHISIGQFKAALKDYPKYQIDEEVTTTLTLPEDENAGTWLSKYKPIVLIFIYILIATVTVEIIQGNINWMSLMQHFMAGFFLTFSFFKFLDIRGFAESYSTYDIVARNWRGWGYLYAFIELALGISFLVDFEPMLTNGATFVIMSVSLIGVLQAVLNKRKIQCACLGVVFNLPMSRVTIIEDGLMILMSAIMIVNINAM